MNSSDEDMPILESNRFLANTKIIKKSSFQKNDLPQSPVYSEEDILYEAK